MSKQLFYFCLLFVSTFSVTWNHTAINDFNKEASCFIILSPSDTTYRIISSTNNTYGYEILINKKTFIRQLNIPGRPGLNGFRRKRDAEKVAQLVLKKLANGIMPPSIEKAEMRKLKIKY
jgi:hypothetical protein